MRSLKALSITLYTQNPKACRFRQINKRRQRALICLLGMPLKPIPSTFRCFDTHTAFYIVPRNRLFALMITFVN